MSRASKLTLAGTTLGAVGTIVFVHFSQEWERVVITSQPFVLLPSIPAWRVLLTVVMSQGMHAGVVRDMEQQRVKRERQADFDMQKQLEGEYRKMQTVHDGDQTEAQGKAKG